MNTFSSLIASAIKIEILTIRTCTIATSNFTQAYHRNIRYPTHLLLTFQWYSPQWWLVEDQNYTCTGEQRGEALHMTLSVDIFNTSHVDKANYQSSMNIVSFSTPKAYVQY